IPARNSVLFHGSSSFRPRYASAQGLHIRLPHRFMSDENELGRDPPLGRGPTRCFCSFLELHFLQQTLAMADARVAGNNHTRTRNRVALYYDAVVGEADGPQVLSENADHRRHALGAPNAALVRPGVDRTRER